MLANSVYRINSFDEKNSYILHFIFILNVVRALEVKSSVIVLNSLNKLAWAIALAHDCKLLNGYKIHWQTRLL